MDLSEFAAEVGSDGPVTITGLGSRGGAVPGVRCVTAPAGIESLQADEMTLRCGAGTPMAELVAALGDVGQTVAIEPYGTIGGALSIGHSSVRRLGVGPIRDVLLQAHFVNAAGDVIRAGGPTVKNVSGFDLCRLLVGAGGTLGFLGEVIVRTRPRPPVSRWFVGEADPERVLADTHRPAAVLWDGTTTWLCLEGHAADVGEAATRSRLSETDGPPPLPAHRWSVAPTTIRATMHANPGRFVAEMGVGVIHHEQPAPRRIPDPAVLAIHRRLWERFDPTGRLNPGRRPFEDLAAAVGGGGLTT